MSYENEFPQSLQDTIDSLVSTDGYHSFLQLCSSKRIDTSDRLSYEEWVNLIDPDYDTSKLKDYRVNLPPIKNIIASNSNLLKTIGISAATQDAFIAAAAGRLKSEISRRAGKTASDIFTKINEGKGGDGGTSESNYSGGSKWNPTGLSFKNKPIDTNFDTDIPFIGAEKYYLDGDNHNSPLILKQGVPGLIDFDDAASHTLDTQLHNYVIGPFAGAWQRAVTQKLTSSSYINSLVSARSIVTYLNCCLQACMTYYFFTSIIAYTNDPRNKNAAMDKLANSLSPEDQSNLFILQRTIEQAVIPPFIHKYSFAMMGNYKQSHLPGSPMIKIMPWFFETSNNEEFSIMGTVAGEGSIVYGPILNAIECLRINKSVMEILSKCFDNWIAPVYEYTSAPRYDANFTTFWCNSYYKTVHGMGDDQYINIALPTASSDADEITWNADTDAPDGWVQSMQSILIVPPSGNIEVGPGLFKARFVTANGTLAFATSGFNLGGTFFQTTCTIFDVSISGTEGFYDISKFQRFQALAKNTYSTSHNSITYSNHQKFGSELIKLQTGEVIRQAVFKFLDLYLLDLQKVASKPRRDYSKGKGRKMMDKGEE